MKAIFFSLILVSTLSHAASIQLSGPSVVTTSTFDVAVDVTNVFANFPGEAVTAFGFNVTSSTGITFLGATINSAFFDDFSGCCVGTAVIGLSDAGFLAGVGPSDFTEPLLLATLHFSAAGVGPATVGVTADNNADLNQGLYFLSGAESFSASERLTLTTATPEPATILVSALGLFGLSMMRRRRIAQLTSRSVRKRG
jgi:hypothetical protein